MLHRLYNPCQITNSGEREADKQLSINTGDEMMLVMHGLRISSRFNKIQMAGDVVFLLCTALADRKEYFQLFIGASGAKEKVFFAGRGIRLDNVKKLIVYKLMIAYSQPNVLFKL